MNGDLPKGWVETTLGEVADTQLGKMLSKKSRTGVGERPYLRNRNVQWFRFDLDDLAVMDFTDAEVEKFRVEPGDVLVCEGGEVGRAAIWTDASTEMLYQKAVHRVRASKAIEPRLIPYYLRWMQDRRAFDKHTTGVTIGHLPQEDLRVLPLPLAPTREQCRLVASLEEQVTRLDATEASLLHTRSSAELLERRFREVDTDAEYVALGSLTTEARYGTSVRCGYDGQGPAVLRIPNIGVGTVSTSDLKYASTADDLTKYFVDAGDLLFVRSNGSRDIVGRVAPAPSLPKTAFASYLILVRLDRSRVLPEFTALALSGTRSRAAIERMAASTAGQYNLNLPSIRSLEIPLPQLDEQRRIVAEVEWQLSILDSVKVAVDHALVRCGQLRRSILERAFTGRLVPQDPDDEPAEVLLERIRAERAAAAPPKRRRGGATG